MALRFFVSQGIDELKTTLAALEKAGKSGSLVELRASGIVARNAALGPEDIARLYRQCRYELYLRANSLPDTNVNKAALVEQWNNPYREKAMKVHSRSSVGVFGYPLPAPSVPPTP